MSHLHVTPGISFKPCLRAVEFCYMVSRLAVCNTPVLVVVGMVPKPTNLHHATDLPELHALHSLTCRTYVYLYAPTFFSIFLGWSVSLYMSIHTYLPLFQLISPSHDQNITSADLALSILSHLPVAGPAFLLLLVQIGPAIYPSIYLSTYLSIQPSIHPAISAYLYRWAGEAAILTCSFGLKVDLVQLRGHLHNRLRFDVRARAFILGFQYFAKVSSFSAYGFLNFQHVWTNLNMNKNIAWYKPPCSPHPELNAQGSRRMFFGTLNSYTKSSWIHLIHPFFSRFEILRIHFLSVFAAAIADRSSTFGVEKELCRHPLGVEHSLTRKQTL